MKFIKLILSWKQIIIVSITLSSLYTNQVLSYGKTHAYITEKALDVWPANNNHEIYKYIIPGSEKDNDGTIKLSNLRNHHRPEKDNQYIGNTILEGVVEEDYGLRSLKIPSLIPIFGGEYLKEWVDHFWNPDDNTKWLSFGLSQTDCDVAPFCLSAFEKGALWFAAAYSVYKEGDEALAFYYLGRAAHCLQDMAVPAHVLGDLHIANKDEYEKWADGNFKSVPIVKFKKLDFNSNELLKDFSIVNVGIFKSILYNLDDFSEFDCVFKSNTAIQNINRLRSIVSQKILEKIETEDINEKHLNQQLFKLKILFYNLAQASQHFPSDDRHGNDVNLPPFASGWPAVDQNHLLIDDNLAAISTCLISRAVQFTGTLYSLFWETTHSTEVIPSLKVNIASIDPSEFPRIKLYTSIEDSLGEPIFDLGSYHCKVYEDKTLESPISVSSVGASFVGTSVCIVMDTSGSMDGYPIRNAREAAVSFVNNLKPEDKAALVRFNEYVTIEQPFTINNDDIINAISRLYADGNTAFYDAVYKGVAMASTQPGIRAVVALTDGVDNSSIKTAKEVVDYAKSVNVPVYIVGFAGGDGIDERTLRLIADETEAQYYQTADVSKLVELYESISERLRNLYEISYTTHNKEHDKNIRTVTIKVTYDEISGQDTITYISPGLEGAISGIVLDGETGEPIKSASILVEHETEYFKITDASTSTNENGEYLVENLSVEYEYKVTASAMNYHKSTYSENLKVKASEIIEGINFELQSVDTYFAAKLSLIQELRDSEEIYIDEENKAEQFLRNMGQEEEPTTEQEEALRRLYMVENFSKEAYTDSKRLAQLGTDGLGGFLDVGMAIISACGGVGEALKKIPFVGNFLSSPYIAAKNEMVNHIAVKSHIFLYQNYNVPWTLKGDILLRDGIGEGYDKIFLFASKELGEKGFSDAMAEVHKFIEKEFFLGIYELTTANFMDKSVE
ncbi:VWA domain-containing protein, partial [Candidatus Poribacteria bacterium]|nr:VWA domain-containing protein [Candidatus Poribacteria bacterium]